ncbi:MAG: transcriptional repressor [Gammaproteobacteria bacterium]|jgi:Fur family iron response transcriptional regulator|nr:transcriptional repressor [Gammaproteobacteria bacterium]|tara:strand:+ start:4156 stop:4575 length:420 start_codon:yes stop_codon:yes gene_type:complete
MNARLYNNTMNIEYLLKDKNITPTKQRLEIAELIFAKDQHFTAVQLIEQVKDNKLPISQATVYNTLCLFESTGLLKTIDLQNDYKFYDTNLKSHHHMYNISTNTLVDINTDKIEFSKMPDIPNNLKLEQTEVLIKVRNK